MNRAYSILTVKAVTEEGDERVLTGVATTPAPDRVGDIVEPKGVKFKNPMPLLWQHQSDKPVGTVKFDKPTDEGVTFEARLPKIEDAGTLKDRVDEAWQSVKAGLVRAVSIGFRVLDDAVERIEGGSGLRFLKTEVLELSLVTIPANSQATIQTIKSIDAPVLAATGKEPGEDDRPVPPGVSGKSTKPVNLKMPKEGSSMTMTIAEQITALESKRAAHYARLDEIQSKAAAEGRTKDEAEKEEFDGLADDIDAIDAELKDARRMEKAQAVAAKPVADVKTAKEGSDARAGLAPVRVKQHVEPGIRFARYAKALAVAHADHRPIDNVIERMYHNRDPELVHEVKAAVSAMTTDNTEALIGNVGGVADFVELLSEATIVGRFGSGGIPSLTTIPFRVPFISETGESDAGWVGEGKAKPLTRPTYGRNTLDPLKVATLAVQTMEVLRDSSPASEMLVRNSLIRSIAKRIDITFIDPTNSGSAGVRPASILNGIAAVPSAGTDADSIREDVRAMKSAFIAANNPINSGVWIMSADVAMTLSLVRNALGSREFPDVDERGGRFEGYPVVTSQHVTDFVALVNAEDIYFGDEGGVDVAMSTEASLEMADNPTGDSGASSPVHAELVSMFQTNSVAFRAERTVNWMRRRASAVAWLSGVAWGTSEGEGGET